MRSIVLAVAVSAFLTAAAEADSGALTGLPSTLLAGGAAEGTQHVLPQPPVSSISAGGLAVALGETTLTDVAAALGGTVATASDGSQSAAWLCYTATVAGRASYFWFVSNSGEADGKVDLVAANFRTAATPQPCASPKADLAQTDFSVPGLGASESALAAHFGGAVAPRAGLVAYSSEQGSVLQNLNYLIENDTVTGLAVTRIAGP